MIRSTSFIALAAICGLAVACQPAKTKEQIAAEQAAEAAKQLGAIFGGMTGAAGTTPADQAQAAQAMGAVMGAAMAQAGADPNMSPEDRAKMQAALGAFNGGPQNPAAKAYVDQLVKVGPILTTIKDDASAKAAEMQLAPIFAAMKPSADALNALSDSDREIAMASATPQMMQFSMSMMGLLGPLMNNPQLSDRIDGIMKQMPEVKD